MGEDKQQEPREQQDPVDLSRFTMNVVEGEDTDRPAEKPKRSIALVALVLAGVVAVAAIVTWLQTGGAISRVQSPREGDKATAFLDGLRRNPQVSLYLADADFLGQDRLRIVIRKDVRGEGGASEPVTQTEVEHVVRVATQAFAEYRPSDALTVHAFQGGTQVAAGLYDVQSKRVTVVSPLPLPGESIGGTFHGASPGGP
jgi:hypothetical protein